MKLVLYCNFFYSEIFVDVLKKKSILNYFKLYYLINMYFFLDFLNAGKFI